MKKLLLPVFLILFLFDLSVQGQDLPIRKRVNESIYGNWFRSDEFWADTRERPDLIVHKNGKVEFKQTLFINPCSFEFDGFLKKDTIYHISTLSCLDEETGEMKFARRDAVKYRVDKVSSNYLAIVEKKHDEVTTYVKAIDFSSIYNLITSQRWSLNINGIDCIRLNLERSKSSWQKIAPTDYSVWEFQKNGNLYIDYGEFKDSLKWTLRTDSIIEVSSGFFEKNNIAYKINNLQRSKLNLNRIEKTYPAKKWDKIPGRHFSNGWKKGKKYFSIVLYSNHCFQISRSPANGEMTQCYGYYEIGENPNELSFQIFKYAISEIDTISGNQNSIWRFPKERKKYILDFIESDEFYHLVGEWDKETVRIKSQK